MDYTQLHGIISSFKDKKILCIGDVMLDKYIYGTVNRISPEAPVPIISIDHEEVMLGGAGNVARNLAALGAQVTFVTAVGNDGAGFDVMRLIGKEKNITPYVTTDMKRKTTLKMRYCVGMHHIVRVDYESNNDPYETVDLDWNEFDAVVIADYCKGVVHRPVINGLNVPVIVDTKKKDWSMFIDSTVITPNEQEYGEAKSRDSVDNILVTKSNRGMTLKTNGTATDILPMAREVYDVVGAGDTVSAVLALGLASNLTVLEAATLANIAAGIVVGKKGTAVVEPMELKMATLELLEKN